MRHTRAFLTIVPVVLGMGFAASSCGKVQPGGTGDASSIDSGTAGSGAAGHAGAGRSGSTGAGGSGGTGTGGSGKAGAGGSGGTGTGGSGSAGAGGSGGTACGSKTCAPGGNCCFACISLCAAPGETCPVFIQDPCSQRDAAADAGQACSDKNPACASGQVCDLNQPGRCGASTAGGTCITKPTACTKIYAPVCGCDGKTYGNDCERQIAGSELDHAGACGGMACGTATCGPGETCVNPCCGGAPPLPGMPPCTPPPPFCMATASCRTQGNSTCCLTDAGAGCCGIVGTGALLCLCA